MGFGFFWLCETQFDSRFAVKNCPAICRLLSFLSHSFALKSKMQVSHMTQDSKEKTIKENMAKIRVQGYPLIRDIKAEKAVEIMSEILERKKRDRQGN